jgi:predicted DNA binding CopG/RHH family protein
MRMQCILHIMLKRDDQVCLRIAGELRTALEREAAEHGWSLSKLVRKVLVDHAAHRAVERTTATVEQAAA